MAYELESNSDRFMAPIFAQRCGAHIPAEVLKSETLTPADKVVYGFLYQAQEEGCLRYLRRLQIVATGTALPIEAATKSIQNLINEDLVYISGAGYYCCTCFKVTYT